MRATRRREAQAAPTAEPALAWPGDPETVSAADIDFRALARVLANTCRHGGRMAAYHSLAGHALLVSEEIETLDGLADEDRRTLALHALIADAPRAWPGTDAASSQRAAERAGRLGARVERAVREAAGLDPELPDEHAELLRFVARMAAAAERRDLGGADDTTVIAFPPLKVRIRPLGPEKAARLWLARFEALARPPRETGGGALNGIDSTNEEEAGDVAHLQETEQEDPQAARTGAGEVRNAA